MCLDRRRRSGARLALVHDAELIPNQRRNDKCKAQFCIRRTSELFSYNAFYQVR